MVVNTSRRKHQGLLLDFSGVLTTDLFEAYRALCQQVMLPADALSDLLTDDPEGHALLVRLECGEIGQPDFEQAVGARLGIDGTSLIQRGNHLEPEPLLLDFAERARIVGIRTGVLSNSLGLAPFNSYAAWRLSDRFDVVVLSEDARMRKPDPAIFALAVRKLGVPAEACVFVDDMSHNLGPAQTLGMTTLHHRDPKQTVTTLEQLFAFPQHPLSLGPSPRQ